MKNIILFSQAPADIQYVLYLYTKYKDSHKIKIVVVNVKNSYKFYQSLDLEATVEFVPLIPKSQMVKFLLYSLRLRKIYSKIFSFMKNAKVYFFAKNYDYVTAFFIERLTKNNDIYFHDIYHIDGKEVNSIGISLKKILSKLFFGIKVKFFSLHPNIAYQYQYDRKKVTEIDLKIEDCLLSKYKYTIKDNKNNKENLLFFESNGEKDFSFSQYKVDLKKILDIVCIKYNVYIKPHPRLGRSAILDAYKVKFIPDFIPSELINMNDFNIVLGINSASIATTSHPNSYCLIEMFSFVDDDRKKHLRKYLENNFDTKLNFITLNKLKQHFKISS
jgi:hypothetical protein